MTHSELFTKHPRPWGLSTKSIGVVEDATGKDVFTVDTPGNLTDEEALALAKLLMSLVISACE
jgi:hypothetical protein